MIDVEHALSSDILSFVEKIGLEFLRQVPDLDMILVPISGGGMTSGIAIAAAKLNPKTQGSFSPD